ncbi:MAG TPA: monovalent cation:proton antiporter family protein [Limnochordia bacterium]|nr:monovalent cation:proton antiporter family protein [Limnochordia bacterium]
MQEHSVSFASLVIVATAAFAIPLLLRNVKRFRIPVVVGELIVGIALGKSGLNIVRPDPWLEFLSLLGITYLMFLSGVEIDFALLGRLARAKAGRRAFVLSGAYLVLVLAGGVAIGFLFSHFGLVSNPWLIALILATVSVGLTLATLKEKQLGATEYGQTILIIALAMDVTTMLLLAALVALVAGGDPAQLALIGLLFVAVFLVYLGGRRFGPSPLMSELAHATSQIGVRGAFMLIFIFAFLSETLGIEVILGAFLAGAIVSLISQSDETSLHLKLDAIGFGFLVPVFFIMVGAEFDVAALIARPEALLLALSIIIAAYVIKVLPATIFAKRYGLKEALALGVVVTPGLSLAVAAAEIGFRLGLLNASTHSAMILLAIVTAALSPLIFERLVPSAPGQEKERVVIVGANERGVLLATRLNSYQGRLLLVDKDPAKVALARDRGFEAVQADVADPATWEGLALDGPTTVVVTTQDDDVNLKVVSILKGSHAVESIIAHASDPEIAAAMERMGARAVTPALSTLTVMENLVRHPDLFALLNQEDEAVKIKKVAVRRPNLAGVRLRDLSLPEGALILSIARGRETIIPRGETRLELGDILTLAGEREHVEKAAENLTW